MHIIVALVFVGFIGVLSLLFKRNLLSAILSMVQITMSVLCFFSLFFSNNAGLGKVVLIFIFLIGIMCVFGYLLAIMLVKRRSTLDANELRELRG